MLDLKRVRPLDAAILTIALIVLGLGAYLGVSVWMNQRRVVGDTPVARDIEDLKNAVRKEPNNLGVRLELAQAFSVAGLDREAAEQYQQILTAEPDNIAALSGIGFSALKQKKWSQGEKYFRRVIEILEKEESEGGERPELEYAFFYVGSALFEQGNFEEAAQFLKEALAIRRDASDTHYLLAACFRELGSMENYRESLENAILFEPKMPEANYDLGRILLDEGKRAEAAERFRIAADAAPGIEKPIEALAEFGGSAEHLAQAQELAKKQPKKALEEARIAAAIDPRSVPALLLAGDLYTSTGDADRAKEMYRKVIAVEPSNAKATKALEKAADGS